jgi:hypothetical protein
MTNVLQILSSNYSGKSVNITFTSTSGDTLSFANVSLPYNFINNTFDGNYTLFFPDYNLTHKFQIPTVPVVNKCRCTEFVFKSFIGGKSNSTYVTCDGSVRKLTLKNGQIHRDCVKINQITAGTNTNVTSYGYCNSVTDCISLTQPPTPTQTKTPTPTPQVTPTQTPLQTVTPTQTPSITPSITPTTTLGIIEECLCINITNLTVSANTILYYSCQYPFFGNVLIQDTLNPNQTKKVCGIYNTVSGSNVNVSYVDGLCQNLNGTNSCPQ